MSRDAQLESYMEDNRTMLELFELIPYKDRETIDEIVLDALREAGYEPIDLAWNVIVEFFDERESE